MKIIIPYHKQKRDHYCGPATLQMAFAFFKYRISQSKLAKQAKTNLKTGTSHRGMINAIKINGFQYQTIKGSDFNKISVFLKKHLPIIVNFIEPSHNEGHYAIVVGITKTKIILNDPWNGNNFVMSRNIFFKRWHDSKNTAKKWMLILYKE